MKTIIIQRIFPDYRKAIFDKLHNTYGIKLFHGKNASGIHQIETNYSTRIGLWQLSKKETLAFLFGFRKIFKSKPDVIIHEFTIGVPSLLIIRVMAWLMGAKFITWGHNISLGRNFRPFSNLSDFYRYLIMKSSDAILFYSPNEMMHVTKYIQPEKLFVAYNALDTDSQRKNYDHIALKSREEVKEELNIDATYNLIFISRLLPTKKTEQIIEIFSLLNEAIKEKTVVHIIGDGPMFKPLQELIAAKGYEKHIILYGKITDPLTLGKLLYISDFMVNPGYLGLSVNLSFAYGCPIITFDNPHMEQMHSPEVYYLKHNETGIIINNLDLSELANALSDALQKDKHLDMRQNCINTIYSEGSINQMFGGFEKALSFVSKNKI